MQTYWYWEPLEAVKGLFGAVMLGNLGLSEGDGIEMPLLAPVGRIGCWVWVVDAIEDVVAEPLRAEVVGIELASGVERRQRPKMQIDEVDAAAEETGEAVAEETGEAVAEETGEAVADAAGEAPLPVGTEPAASEALGP